MDAVADRIAADARRIAELQMQVAHVQAVIGDAVILGGRARALLARMGGSDGSA
jgi:hypothetical protein